MNPFEKMEAEDFEEDGYFEEATLENWWNGHDEDSAPLPEDKYTYFHPSESFSNFEPKKKVKRRAYEND